MHYCTHEHLPNGLVRKKLVANEAHAERLLTRMVGDHPPMTIRAYLAALRAARVQLPTHLTLEEHDGIAVVHTWVEGQTLEEVFELDPSAYLASIEQIQAWQRTLHQQQADALLDTNLQNFIIQAEGPVLIDVLPPLRPSRIYEPQDPYEYLFINLCLCYNVSVTAMLGYALRPFLNAPPQGLRRRIDTLVEGWQAKGKLPPHQRQPHDLFSARLQLMLAALDGQVAANQVSIFYTLTSMRKLMTLSAPEQQQQIARAWSFYDCILR